MPLQEKTVPYKTYIKQSVTQALKGVFNAHVDELLARTKVSIEYPTDKVAYPAVIVRFFEREIYNAGVGHEELLTINSQDFRFKHYMYKGDIEFAIHALSSVDRDLISDSLVQTFAMGDLTTYTNRLFQRIYTANFSEFPKAEYNYINLNTDMLSPTGETQTPAPWGSEDDLVYQTAYRVGVFGEFYSLPPTDQDPVGYIERVDQYPYIKDIEEVPTGADDPAEWQPPGIEDE